MKVLGLMMPSLVAFPFAQFYFKLLQSHILTLEQTNPNFGSRNASVQPNVSLTLCISSPTLELRTSFLPQIVEGGDNRCHPGVEFTINWLSSGPGPHRSQNFPLSFWNWEPLDCLYNNGPFLLHGHPVKVQSDNSMAVAYINHQSAPEVRLP